MSVVTSRLLYTNIIILKTPGNRCGVHSGISHHLGMVKFIYLESPRQILLLSV
jgi:hypothetical protein